MFVCVCGGVSGGRLDRNGRAAGCGPANQRIGYIYDYAVIDFERRARVSRFLGPDGSRKIEEAGRAAGRAAAVVVKVGKY